MFSSYYIIFSRQTGFVTEPTTLAFLLLHPAERHPRSRLAFLIAPDVPERKARRLLSRALWDLRRTLPLDLLTTEGDTIVVRSEPRIWVDVSRFEELTRPYEKRRPRTDDDIKDLQRAVALYRGDLLEDFYEDWVLGRRERLRETYLQALLSLSEWAKRNGRYYQALTFILKLLQTDPLQEAAHREAMRLYGLLDRPEAALQQYQTCRQILADEMGIEPDAETTALARAFSRRAEHAAPPHVPKIPAHPTAIVFDPAATIPLVGREKERAALLEYIAALFAGDGGVILVAGAPGVGKTRLLQEIARDAEWRGARVARGSGHELSAETPYGPLVEALRTLLTPLRVGQLRLLIDDLWLRAVVSLLPELTTELPELPPLDSEQGQTRLWEAMARVICALGEHSPILLILDDLQWGAPEVLAALAYLTRQVAHSRVMIIACYRDDEARADEAVWQGLQAIDSAGVRERLRLRPLSPAGSEALIRQGLGQVRHASTFARRLHRQTGGNPLFILETLRALRGEGMLTQDEGRDLAYAVRPNGR